MARLIFAMAQMDRHNTARDFKARWIWNEMSQGRLTGQRLSGMRRWGIGGTG
jgi:hypothetical protein